PSTDTWASQAAMPTARYYLAAGVINGVLSAVGGFTGSATAVNEAYNPSTDTWASQAAIPTGRYGLAAGVVNSTLYAVGGIDDSGRRTAVNEGSTPPSSPWPPGAPM